LAIQSQSLEYTSPDKVSLKVPLEKYESLESLANSSFDVWLYLSSRSLIGYIPKKTTPLEKENEQRLWGIYLASFNIYAGIYGPQENPDDTKSNPTGVFIAKPHPYAKLKSVCLFLKEKSDQPAADWDPVIHEYCIKDLNNSFGFPQVNS
jgi:hypothetical protein